LETPITSASFTALLDAINGNFAAFSAIAEQCREELKLSMTWIGAFLDGAPGNHAALLAEGAYGSAVEAVSLAAFGLARPSSLALRSHYELSLQYLYYKDHPKEWAGVSTFRAQGLLPSVVKKYLKENYPSFEERYTKLLKVKTRASDDVYGVLSGVAHGYALNAIPLATKPEQILGSIGALTSLKALFHDTAEVISDTCLASFESNWMSVPDYIKESVSNRLNGKNPGTELSF